jgi:hypothetical protein
LKISTHAFLPSEEGEAPPEESWPMKAPGSKSFLDRLNAMIPKQCIEFGKRVAKIDYASSLNKNGVFLYKIIKECVCI